MLVAYDRARTATLTRIARGVGLPAAKMNRLEAAYGQQLELRKAAGDILWWEFEAIKLRLAPSTFYTPDFFLMLADGELQVHETKGHWEDDARVKIKMAAQLFPFRFFGVTRGKGRGAAFTMEAFP